jgi:anoctamin-10
MASTPQRSTRSKSSQNVRPGLTTAKSTAPGPPVPARDSSTVLDAVHLSNPFHVDLVIPYSIALGKGDRISEQREIRDGYESLLRDLEGVGGLKLASKVPKGEKGKEEVWLFIGLSDDKFDELVQMERFVGLVKDTSIIG